MTTEYVRAPARLRQPPDAAQPARTLPRRRPLARLRQWLIVVAAVKPVSSLDRKLPAHEAEYLSRRGMGGPW